MRKVQRGVKNALEAVPKGLIPKRCAIYGRVSTDQNLDQEFNSLDAQREACAAYIQSQRPEGWILVKCYDDGGFSGGTLARPGVQQLLSDVENGLIDVIVVYKVDRLTRSLADFAKLVELFDSRGASFVSVTQAFNTTSSMGRLTLNVLLSFAQFEREVTGERIRDKVAASKQKGIWVGGVVPLGYRVENRKLLPDEAEAATVVRMFERYLEVPGLTPLVQELREQGVRTRQRQLADGRIVGGISFKRAALLHILRNRVYVGDLNHRGRSYPGEHPPIVPQPLFDAVQRKLDASKTVKQPSGQIESALLMGKIHDDAGNRMTPSHANKRGVRYRYYVSRALGEGDRNSAGTVARVAAPELEAAVVEWLRSRSDDCCIGDRELIDTLLEKLVLKHDRLEITLLERADSEAERIFELPWSKPSFRRRRQIIAADPGATDAGSARAMSSEQQSRLLDAIADARRWLDEIAKMGIDTTAIAVRVGRSERSVRMGLSLAFLAPDIVQAILDRTLSRTIGLSRLAELPMLWADQRRELGLPAI